MKKYFLNLHYHYVLTKNKFTNYLQISIDDIAFKKKTNPFWSVGALKRDNQFVIFTT